MAKVSETLTKINERLEASEKLWKKIQDKLNRPKCNFPANKNRRDWKKPFGQGPLKKEDKAEDKEENKKKEPESEDKREVQKKKKAFSGTLI